MSDAIEQAAAVIGRMVEFTLPCGYVDADAIANELADAGLLAPAPLREVRSHGTLRGTMLHPCDNSDEAEYVRYMSNWLPAEEGS